MSKQAFLILEDGSIYYGDSFGYQGETFGEIVFNTSMTGYQEMLTDPSYAGQIVVPTYPLLGNYGINPSDVESREIQVSGFVVRQYCEEPSHTKETQTLNEYLVSQEIVGVSEVDTRAITRRIRSKGVMMGAIAVNISPEQALKQLKTKPAYDELNFVQKVTAREHYEWTEAGIGYDPIINNLKILVSDYGLKYNILRILKGKGCEVEVFPSSVTADELLAQNPDGILLSPGPGDPELLEHLVTTTSNMLGKIPIMGICLGNQILAKSLGAKTYKLKFGHRGANHPVKDMISGKVHITAQNHGYSIDPDSLSSEVDITHISMNDYTVEGI
ncbi:MAG: glutamine-hydrolyzing carbamoyl-phosphate synthase small subunit, partial [Chloroflexota bacterium]|nr:glutamine-hydrolyzing carbamoyl-phosphate synthase small subunit [Chloroflexota bacterium]